MKFSHIHLIIIAILALNFVIALYAYPNMPESVATHWGISGGADGYSSRLFGTFFLPALSLLLTPFMLFIPKIDPKSANISKFSNYYEWLIVVLLLFMLYIYALSVVWNLGTEFNFSQAIMPGFAALIFAIGALLKNTKQNYSIGIRTPWTLASEEVWEKTHKLGGTLFKVAAVVSLAGIVFPSLAFILAIGSVVGVALFLVVYSYVIFKKSGK